VCVCVCVCDISSLRVNELFFNTHIKFIARNRPNCDEVVSYCLLAVQYNVSVPVLSVFFQP